MKKFVLIVLVTVLAHAAWGAAECGDRDCKPGHRKCSCTKQGYPCGCIQH